MGAYRFQWGDHLVRAYQVLLFVPLDRVRCFDATELGGEHGCPRQGENKDDLDLVEDLRFQFTPGLQCPQSQTGEEMRIPLDPGAGTLDLHPRPCMEHCGMSEVCQGFDVVWEESGIRCLFRALPTDDDCVEVREGGNRAP